MSMETKTIIGSGSNPALSNKQLCIKIANYVCELSESFTFISESTDGAIIKLNDSSIYFGFCVSSYLRTVTGNITDEENISTLATKSCFSNIINETSSGKVGSSSEGSVYKSSVSVKVIKNKNTFYLTNTEYSVFIGLNEDYNNVSYVIFNNGAYVYDLNEKRYYMRSILCNYSSGSYLGYEGKILMIPASLCTFDNNIYYYIDNKIKYIYYILGTSTLAKGSIITIEGKDYIILTDGIAMCITEEG